MANKVYIEYKDPFIDIGNSLLSGTSVIEVPLIEDPLLELQSSFQDLGDMIPGAVRGIFDLMRNLGRVGGTASKNFEALLALPLWQKTEPVKMVLKLIFYTKDDPENDVVNPMRGLFSQAILQDKGKNKFSVPGLSMRSYGIIKRTNKSKGLEPGKVQKIRESINLISLEIPGVIYLPFAIILSAKPSYSKQLTTAGLPLWGMLDIEVRSIYPANDKMFETTISKGTKINLLSEVLAAQASATLL